MLIYKRNTVPAGANVSAVVDNLNGTATSTHDFNTGDTNSGTNSGPHFYLRYMLTPDDDLIYADNTSDPANLPAFEVSNTSNYTLDSLETMLPDGTIFCEEIWDNSDSTAAGSGLLSTHCQQYECVQLRDIETGNTLPIDATRYNTPFGVTDPADGTLVVISDLASEQAFFTNRYPTLTFDTVNFKACGLTAPGNDLDDVMICGFQQPLIGYRYFQLNGAPDVFDNPNNVMSGDSSGTWFGEEGGVNFTTRVQYDVNFTSGIIDNLNAGGMPQDGAGTTQGTITVTLLPSTGAAVTGTQATYGDSLFKRFIIVNFGDMDDVTSTVRITSAPTGKEIIGWTGSCTDLGNNPALINDNVTGYSPGDAGNSSGFKIALDEGESVTFEIFSPPGERVGFSTEIGSMDARIQNNLCGVDQGTQFHPFSLAGTADTVTDGVMGEIASNSDTIAQNHHDIDRRSILLFAYCGSNPAPLGTNFTITEVQTGEILSGQIGDPIGALTSSAPGATSLLNFLSAPLDLQSGIIQHGSGIVFDVRGWEDANALVAPNLQYELICNGPYHNPFAISSGQATPRMDDRTYADCTANI